MTLTEAETLGKIIATADRGCYYCVGALADALNEEFAEYVWAVPANPDDWYAGRRVVVTRAD